MTQLSLDYTSAGRAISAEGHELVDAARMRGRVYDLLRQVGPATADGLADYMGLPLNSVAPRLTELGKAGLVRRTGDRRETRSGGSAAVLEVVQR
jgi:predicted ArsR family transcriptional regulator